MSGRLVLLPHKAWNVWNQDNREKVLRDERLDREQKVATAKDEQGKRRKLNYDNLRKDTNTKSIEDEEAEQSYRFHNADFARELEKEVQRKKRREGVADWQFGKGPFQGDGGQLWYNKRDSSARCSKSVAVEEKFSADGQQQAEQRSSSHSGEVKAVSTEETFALLRQKRLRREQNEGKKAAVLRAQHDVHGCGDGLGYSQQYHPKLARNK